LIKVDNVDNVDIQSLEMKQFFTFFERLYINLINLYQPYLTVGLSKGNAPAWYKKNKSGQPDLF